MKSYIAVIAFFALALSSCDSSTEPQKETPIIPPIEQKPDLNQEETFARQSDPYLIMADFIRYDENSSKYILDLSKEDIEEYNLSKEAYKEIKDMVIDMNIFQIQP